MIVDDLGPGGSFGAALRERAIAGGWDGVVALGSGSLPLATRADRAAFVAAAWGAPGTALANNRYSADAIAIAGRTVLRDLPDVASDNGLPRLLERAGVAVRDLRERWRLQVDLDSPLDAVLTNPARTFTALAAREIDVVALRAALAGVAATSRDPNEELLVSGRTSAAGLTWLERHTASRTRALVEERGFRTRRAEQRPVRSSLGLLLDRDGPDGLGPRLTELGDAALVDTRVLLAHRFGADERSVAERRRPVRERSARPGPGRRSMAPGADGVRPRCANPDPPRRPHARRPRAAPRARRTRMDLRRVPCRRRTSHRTPSCCEAIRDEIRRDGPMTFARFMEMALYDPARGYYRSPDARPGRAGDFLTAPEAHPIFGWTIARFARWRPCRSRIAGPVHDPRARRG